MKRIVALFGIFVAAAHLAGCEDPIPPEPKGDPTATWPDEVKQAEAEFAKKAQENASKSRPGARP